MANVATGQELTISTVTHVIHGGTSLKLSEGGPSPVLEAHPGSPVDISGRRCPSLTTYMPAHSYRSDADYVDGEISPSTDRVERSVRRGDVAAKAHTSMVYDVVTDDEQTPTQFRSVQTFYLSDKVADDESVQVETPPVHAQDGSQDVAMETSWIDFDFGFGTGHRIAANKPRNDSKSSLASTTTAISGPNHRRFSHGALTVDTSIASSATSMASSDTSSYSAVTNSTDVYGWDEELDRRMSIENRLAWEPALTRRDTTASRMTVTRSRTDLYDPTYKPADMKRRGLLHRVLNIRRGMGEACVPAPPTANCRATSG